MFDGVICPCSYSSASHLTLVVLHPSMFIEKGSLASTHGPAAGPK